MSEQVFKVRCTQCDVVMKFLPRTAETQLTCPQCGQKMRVKTPLAVIATAAQPAAARPAAVRPIATQATTARPAAARAAAAKPMVKRVAAPAAAGSRPARIVSTPAAGANWADFPTDFGAAPAMPRVPAGPADGQRGAKAGWFSKAAKRSTPATSFPTVSAPRASFATPAPARPSGKGGRVIKKVVLGVAGLIGGVFGLLVMVAVLGVVVGGMGRAQSKSTMSLMGWSVDAPGRPVPGPHGHEPNNKNIVHRTTNSEFSMTTKRVAEQGQAFTIEQIVDGMNLKTSISDVRSVQRAGLAGYQFSLLIPEHGIYSTAEMFKIDEWHVLILVYLPGHERKRAKLGNTRHDAEKIRELDDPDAFFASLRRG